MHRTRTTALFALAAAAVLAAAAWWWSRPAAPPAAEPLRIAEAPAEPEAAPLPTVRHPIEAVAAALGSDAGDPAPPPTLEQRLAALIGRDALVEFVLTDDFARRVAATVDNLGRSHAPAQLWPVHPTAGRFDAVRVDGRWTATAANARRYDAFVRWATGTDAARAVALYLRLYPQLQAAYESLGYPGQAFNDRVVDVIDLLLATPEADAPLALRLTEVQGPIPSTRPWVRYELADPALESLAAGQKVLLRVGPAHARALKGWLAQARALLVGTPPR